MSMAASLGRSTDNPRYATCCNGMLEYRGSSWEDVVHVAFREGSRQLARPAPSAAARAVKYSTLIDQTISTMSESKISTAGRFPQLEPVGRGGDGVKAAAWLVSLHCQSRLPTFYALSRAQKTIKDGIRGQRNENELCLWTHGSSKGPLIDASGPSKLPKSWANKLTAVKISQGKHS